MLILILLGCLFWYFLSKARTGRYLYAVGGNEESAYRSGINTARVQIIAYVINSVFIFLAALFFVGQNQSGDARFGDPFTLRTIASAVVGGIALTGGRGSIFFAIVGALIINLVNKIIFFANIPYAYGTLVAGSSSSSPSAARSCTPPMGSGLPRRDGYNGEPRDGAPRRAALQVL